MKSTIISTTADSISSGGSITGDLTIEGDLSVEGGGSFTYDEMLTGDIIIDKNFTGTTTATTKGLFVDFDATGITASGQTATNIGLDLDMNSDSPTMVGTVVNTGIDIDLTAATSGVQTNVGLDVAVSGADTNYAALFNGGNVGIGTASPTLSLDVVGSGRFSKDSVFSVDSENAQIILRGVADVNKRIYMGYDTTSNYGYLQAHIEGTGPSAIALNPNAGNVGIGGVPTAAKLEIHGGDASTSLIIKGGGTNTGIKFVDSGDTVDGYIYAIAETIGFLDTTGNWRFKVDNNSRISLGNNDGNASNTVFGYKAFTNNGTVLGDVGADYNVAVGEYAMGKAANNGSVYNTAVGYKALEDITTGIANVGIGGRAGASIADGNSNVAIGAYDGTLLGALQTNIVGDFNIAIGTGALSTANEDDNDGTVAIGHLACKVQAGTGGAQFANATVGIGYKALTALTTGAGNTAVGYQALDAEDQGNYTTAVGYNAFSALSRNGDVDVYGVAVGYQAGLNVSTGTTNTFIGGLSAGEATGNVLHGAAHACVGYKSGFALSSSAYYNTLMGAYAGDAITTGTGNTLIGYEADTDAATDSYQTKIGHYGIKKWKTARVTLDTYTGGGGWTDNDAASTALFSIPIYSHVSKVWVKVITLSAGTCDLNIVMGTASDEAVGDTIAGMIELLGASAGTGCITRSQATQNANSDINASSNDTANMVWISNINSETTNSDGWCDAAMYFYVGCANAGNNDSDPGADTVLDIGVEYY